MTDLKQLFKTAVASSMDLRGKPAILGKIDGTLYWSSSRRDMVWARIGENASFQEMVVHCTKVTPQVDLPVRVDMVNGIMSVVAVDEKRYLEFSGNRPGGNVGAHAWLHGRLGPDPLYVAGLQYLPLLVVPSNPPTMTVTVKSGAYRWDGVYKILEETISGSLSAYIPGSASIKHFVIICLDRVNNSIVIVDGDDLTGGDDALFGGIVLTTADILAITDGIDISYVPLAAIVLYNGQTEVRAADITMDLRAWGGGAGTSATFTEPDDDGETYGRMTDTGVSSWVAVVPQVGGEYTGGIGIKMAPSHELDINGTMWIGSEVNDRWVAFGADGFGTYLASWDAADRGLLRVFTSEFNLYTGTLISPVNVISAHYDGSDGELGFFGTSPVEKPSGVKATTALQNLGLGTSLTDYVAATGGTFSGALAVSSGGLTVAGGAVFNEAGADVDHRFEGDTDQNLLFLDGGNDRVGIGTDTPIAYFHLSKSNTTTTPVTGAYIHNTFAPSSAPGVVFPGALTLQSDYDTTHNSGGIQLAQFLNVRNVGNGAISTRCLDISYSNLGSGTVNVATGIHVRANVNSGGGAITTAYGLYIDNQTVAGTNYAIYTNSGQLRFGDGATFGSPAGGYKGVGTINTAADIYKNNSAYTNPDYVLEHHFTGKIVKHATAAKLNQYDGLLPLDQLEDYLKENWHLPNRSGEALGIFGRADWVQEKLEEMALYICQLHKEIEVLKNG